jgi:hypothetical protein
MLIPPSALFPAIEWSIQHASMRPCLMGTPDGQLESTRRSPSFLKFTIKKNNSQAIMQRQTGNQQYPLMQDDSFHQIDIDSIDRLSAALGPTGRPSSLEEGLYANLEVRPDVNDKLPTYTEAVSESIPNVVLNPIRGMYVNPWATTETLGEDEVLVDGIPVGPPILLLINALASMAFDLLGFLITFFLATTYVILFCRGLTT